MTEMMEAAKRMTTTNNTMAVLLETDKNKTIDVQMQANNDINHVRKSGSSISCSRQKKVVQFNNIVIINEIPTHRLLTLDERSLTWYTGIDYRCFILLEQQQQQQTSNKVAPGNSSTSTSNTNYNHCNSNN
ncbi:hypothetical protein FRACYDRAFT_254807 [Fragilariopsis cylindrus CCMP1102]|uniref:Uncharacterized protein n=1 Tax=Fragilariopsis cylindrus CCMP1102 TaxID=635003 RepID=A0A1E7EKC1_9STRA|nr:hypothetical protein FRACYDRAFT_254807 [Fragilariopsis cylindrus CCMP1102]|eukprot:OEU06365.1 hypothetical protein FRACYDRAFT_254807 [Fragilariopsis cylindrus CCMP1102]